MKVSSWIEEQAFSESCLHFHFHGVPRRVATRSVANACPRALLVDARGHLFPAKLFFPLGACFSLGSFRRPVALDGSACSPVSLHFLLVVCLPLFSFPSPSFSLHFFSFFLCDDFSCFFFKKNG